MKTPNTISVIILLLIMAGCGGRNNQSTDSSGTVDVIANNAETQPTIQDAMDREEDLLDANDTILNQSFVQEIIRENHDDIITVDVRRSYLVDKKELILQDFVDVEYIALETNDDFLNQGVVMDIGKEIIAVKNQVNDGNIYIYDRHGKALRKINHKGQGPGEYTFVSNIVLDEDNGEIFVYDHHLRKFFAYDLYGKFKRSLNHKVDTLSRKSNDRIILSFSFYTEIFNYDNNNLICYDRYYGVEFDLISKQDGSIAKTIKIPVKEKKELRQVLGDEENHRYLSISHPQYSITPYSGNWILLELSSDTVYTLMPDCSLRPLIVRTPSVQSMEPEVMLLLRLVSNRYYFMETVRNEWNFNTNTGFTQTFFMYDKQEKAFSGYIVYNGDFSIKKELFMVGFTPVNHREIVSCYPLQAFRLVESYQKGELKDGRLKEIAAKLDPEDNPVIMLVKHKK